jgi:undecaprenyl-diphosphatase
LELWQAIVLGLVEGITEYLPVSSTGHLILASSFMGLDVPEKKEALDAFNIIVQGGAILAVLGLYWPRVVQMVKGFLGKDAAGLKLAVNLLIAFVPAAVLGKLLNEWIEENLFFNGPVLGATFVGGVYMMVLGPALRKRTQGKEPAAAPVEPGVEAAAKPDPLETVTPLKALAIGLMQCVAMWPGTSRSMMTISGGMWMGLAPAAAAEFSFLLGLPTLGAATVYKLYKNVSQAHATHSQDFLHQLGVVPVAVGILVATVSAAISVRWLVGFLNKHGLFAFGVYRVILSAVMLGLVLAGVVRFG